MANFPKFPFDGQELIDIYGVKWVYNTESDCWTREGYTEQIPLANESNSGLLSARLKRKIDSIPSRGGGFAIITRPLKRPMTTDNPDGLIVGDIEFTSESLDIVCVDANGEEMQRGCQVCSEGESVPGFDFKFSDKFLEQFCVRVPNAPGPRGDKGDQGPQGDPGTGDGPVGEQGIPGRSYTEPGEFTGIKIMNDNNIYDTAIVGMELDSDGGVLKTLHSKVRVADDKTPADQIICSQIFRGINFEEDGWGFTIEKIGNDPLDNNPNILHLPDRFIDGQSDCSVITLENFVNAVVDDLKVVYDSTLEQWDKEIREHVLSKDENAREDICALSRELSECEWQLPFEYCLGFNAANCFPGNIVTGGGAGGGAGGEGGAVGVGGGPTENCVEPFTKGDLWTGDSSSPMYVPIVDVNGLYTPIRVKISLFQYTMNDVLISIADEGYRNTIIANLIFGEGRSSAVFTRIGDEDMPAPVGDEGCAAVKWEEEINGNRWYAKIVPIDESAYELSISMVFAWDKTTETYAFGYMGVECETGWMNFTPTIYPVGCLPDEIIR